MAKMDYKEECIKLHRRIDALEGALKAFTGTMHSAKFKQALGNEQGVKLFAAYELAIAALENGGSK